MVVFSNLQRLAAWLCIIYIFVIFFSEGLTYVYMNIQSIICTFTIKNITDVLLDSTWRPFTHEVDAVRFVSGYGNGACPVASRGATFAVCTTG